ncbi:ester cyclase [Puniceibacterium sp. IMCC21224]|uniref:ester cyclase n=1 Tax=Puniceibacterium sp. IMCC21224 TaxID=1618204 RepID=UPI00065D9FC7|nr:ester cyclase [Puniceibacterium sp. IMCC21224]KMK64557.1 putative ester cyclase [Puniceibacterium sp. IMCC21224]
MTNDLLAGYANILTDAALAAASPDTPQEARNKRIVARMFQEIVNKKAYEVADEIFAEEFYWPQFDLKGPEGVKTWARQFHAGWPDVLDRLDLQVAQGDIVVSLVTVYGTHTGNWIGIPATNRTAVFPAIGIDRLQDGKIVERSATFNLDEVKQKIGVGP